MSWNFEDKDWLKQRKADWKKVKVTLDKMGFYDAEDKKRIKEYFLYGPEKENLKQPWDESLNSVEATPLLAVWLHPSDDINEIQKELSRFKLSRPSYIDQNGKEYYSYSGTNRFYENAIGNYASADLNEVLDAKSNACSFHGREILINQMLMPQVVEDEHVFIKLLSENNQEKLLGYSSRALNVFFRFFRVEEPYEYYTPRFRIPYLISTLKYGIDESKSRLLENGFWLLEKIKANPENFHSTQVETAAEFETALVENASVIKKSALDAFEKYREQAREKLRSEGIQPAD